MVILWWQDGYYLTIVRVSPFTVWGSTLSHTYVRTWVNLHSRRKCVSTTQSQSKGMVVRVQDRQSPSLGGLVLPLPFLLWAASLVWSKNRGGGKDASCSDPLALWLRTELMLPMCELREWGQAPWSVPTSSCQHLYLSVLYQHLTPNSSL